MESFGLMTFAADIQLRGWAKIGLTQVFAQVVFISWKSGAFYVSFNDFNLKAVFFQNWTFSGCNTLSQKQLVDLPLKFQDNNAYVKGIHKFLFFWLVAMVTEKKLFFKNHYNRHSGWRFSLYSFTETQNSKIMGSPSFSKWNVTSGLFLNDSQRH